VTVVEPSNPSRDPGRPAPAYDIVGCGAVVQAYHLPVLAFMQSRGEIRIVGCYDPNPTQAREVAEALGAERSAARANPRDDDEVDAALVATPPSLHAAIASEYIDAGKSVFVEKPFTATAQEASDLVAAARGKGVAAAVNQFWRYYPSANLARRWLRDEAVASVVATGGTRMAWSTVSDYMIRDPYGGVMHEFGAHLLDTALYVLGVDETAETGSVEIREVVKEPPTEPSQECRSRMVLQRRDRAGIDWDTTVTRLRTLPQGIRIRGDFGLLFIPAECAPAPILYRAQDAFRLRGAPAEPQAADLHSCFLLAHRDFSEMTRDPGAGSRIEASRFLLLSEILESLQEGRVT
jgi:predicted dehydrogenase